MKTLCKLCLLLFFLCRCDNTDPCKNETCQLSDPRIIGEWKLVEECECYAMGGDFLWQMANRDLTFAFNEQCRVIHGGDESSTCTQGKYAINQDQLNILLACPGGTTVDISYTYTFSTNHDTLMLKNFVDEGFYGAKYHKQ